VTFRACAYLACLLCSCINVDETFMGIKLLRRWLMRQAEVDASLHTQCTRMRIAALRTHDRVWCSALP